MGDKNRFENQYRELAAFSQFASDLDEATKEQLEHGKRITELLKQKQYSPMSVADQAYEAYLQQVGKYMKDVEIDKVIDFEGGLACLF